MKRWLFFIMLCTCGLFDSFTVKSQEALYIFRNDEQLLTPFFYSDIDSITYSAYDEAGKVHNEYVTQVVHTPDSIYRIPLAVIDSITFVQPETIYQPDAYELDARYLPYVKTVDSLTITFTSSLPPELKPSKGNVLYNFAYQVPFERGFLGNVKSVHLNADEIIVDCDLADITEVFKQYVSYQIHKPKDIQTKAVVSDETDTINKDFSLSYSHDIGKIGEFSIDGGCSYSSIIRTKILVLGEEKHICIQSNDEYKLDTDFGLAIKGEAEDDIDILFPVRFPIGILECSIQPQICYSLNASVSLTAAHSSCILKVYHEYGVINGKEYDGKHEWSLTSESNFSKDLTVEGSFLLGANFQLGIGLPMQSLGVGFDLQLAPQFTIDGSISPVKNPGAQINTDLYELKKKANIRLDAVANISPCAFVNGEKIWSAEEGKNHFSLSKTVPIRTIYLFPEFSELAIQTDISGKADISSTVTRDLIFPQQIGYALYDDNNELKEIVYAPDKLQFNKDFKNPMNLSLDHLKHNTQYTVYPIIQHQEQEYLANPAKTFKIDLNIMTGNTTDISTDVAVCHGRIFPIENISGITYGICYGTAAPLSPENGKLIEATADEDGNFKAMLSGLKENTSYYYCAYMQTGDSFYYGETKTFQTEKEDKNDNTDDGNNTNVTQGEAIDLGLSVKWASHNIGASKPEEAGGLYGWGDPTGTHLEHGSNSSQPYYTDDRDLLQTIYGGLNAPDNITKTSRDIAHVKWGGEWRMPTKTEWEELMTKCKWEYISLSDQKIFGAKVTGPNGNSIFLPATGIRESGPNIVVQTDQQFYWTSNRYINTDDEPDYWAHIAFCSRWQPILSSACRFMGCGVRPVMDK